MLTYNKIFNTFLKILITEIALKLMLKIKVIFEQESNERHIILIIFIQNRLIMIDLNMEH